MIDVRVEFSPWHSLQQIEQVHSSLPTHTFFVSRFCLQLHICSNWLLYQAHHDMSRSIIFKKNWIFIKWQQSVFTKECLRLSRTKATVLISPWMILKLTKSAYTTGIYNYMCNRNQCLSPLELWVRTPYRRGVLETVHDIWAGWSDIWAEKRKFERIYLCKKKSKFPPRMWAANPDDDVKRTN